MGQDSEEAAEFVATVRGEHVAMKTWFNSSDAAKPLRDKYGEYPGLWKEVLNWSGWKEARKEYLKSHQQQQESAEAQVPRKRKSRWGSATSTTDEGDNKRRSSRWGDGGQSHAAPPAAVPVTPALPIPGIVAPSRLPPQKAEELRKLQSQLREINDKLDNLDREAARVDALPRGHRERSPSPPPIYGPDGKRKNTRAVRWRQRYTQERADLLERIMNLNPQTRGAGLMVRKRTKKIRIPIEEHPNYNFIGLIIGPRGKTQKELEAKTGCKIAIRGRGSVKEGARGRRDGKVNEGDNEPLHVVITGDDQNAVDAAADMIEQMLVVIDDEKNVHKQQQLRELALLNGTLKEEEFCQICAEKGHRAFECPKRFAMNKSQSIAVKCAICGDTSHPTRDCTQRPTEQTNQQELDSDYQSFMAELEGRKAEKEAPPANSSAPLPPPPPATSGPPKPVDLPLPPPPGIPGVVPPPPPTNLPPPPPVAVPPPPPPAGAAGSYYGNQHQQQSYYGAPQPAYQQPYGQPQHPHGQQQMPQQQQQYSQVRPGEETKGWDPSSYYGYGGNSGAGGFNWWEQ